MAQIRIHNTMTGQKDEFSAESCVGMYVCGPTVYNLLHIGNMRCYVVFDTVRRYLEYRGYTVKLVQNFTDVDDKIIARAAEEGSAANAVAEKYIEEALADMDALNILRAAHYPKVTEEMPEIIAMIELLIDKGFAYEQAGHVFFSSAKVPGYGKLSKKNIDDLEAGARVEVNAAKVHSADFVLWKPAKPDQPGWPGHHGRPDRSGEPAWQSPWGEGRPGWHIECSAMAKKYLGTKVDIHGGGQDLIFPHHENEIAQSESANGADFVRFWMHNGPLTSGHKKMSKSLGNFFTFRDVSQKFAPPVIRFFLLNGHYRIPMEYSEELLQSAKSAFGRIKNCRAKLAELAGTQPVTECNRLKKSDAAPDFKAKFEVAMDDDFNTADAIAVIFDLVKYANKNPEQARELLPLLEELCGLLGISLTEDAETQDTEKTEKIESLIAKRRDARAGKDWAAADSIRDELLAMGVAIKDTPDGVRWHFV